MRLAVAWRLRQARTIAGLTQEQVAERIGDSRTSVARAESGRVSPGLDYVQRWCAATDVPLLFVLRVLDDFLPSLTHEMRRDVEALDAQAARHVRRERHWRKRRRIVCGAVCVNLWNDRLVEVTIPGSSSCSIRYVRTGETGHVATSRLRRLL
jgi:transcriptional regulator with XRE-family HTH domain